jgi:hypothetical protein
MRGEQAEQRRVRDRPDRARWLECRCSAKQSHDLVGTIDVGRAALDDHVPERIGCRNLMTRILGMHFQREAPHRE